MAKFKTAVYISVACIVALLCTMSVFQFMLLFWMFFAGIGVSAMILRPGYEIPNLLLSVMKKDLVVHAKPVKVKAKKCSICGKDNCTREKPEEEFTSLQPWLGIEVTEKVDKAVAEFLELLLEQYVWKWYRDLSEDECFIHELKVAMRHALCVFYRRINQVDLSDVIIKKLLKLSIIHLNVCLSAQDAGCNNEDEILTYYGIKLHRALQSRRSELNYLRALCDHVFPHLFPPSLIKSRVFRSLIREVLASNVILYGLDTITDPDKVNNLLLIFFDETPPKEADFPPAPPALFLAEFASKDNNNLSLLQIDLPKIMTTQEMLYQFMTFLKTLGAVHYLQFCLTVDDFNRRCLATEQTEEQQIKLHKEANEIYTAYCNPESVTFIHFEPDIINELRDITEGRWNKMNKLRTSTPLFRAYDHVYNLLEHLYCPLFYQSDIYYEMVCGKRVPLKKRRHRSRQGSGRMYDTTASSKNQQAQDVFKQGNGSSEENDTDNNNGLLDMDERSSRLDDEMSDDFLVSRDLSTWRIVVPRVDVLRRDDEISRGSSASTNEKMYAFCVEVKRVDIHEDDDMPIQWQVLRRYNEFYVLENKLTEFHGSLAPASLPPKKFMRRSPEFLESKKADFERFLKLLIGKPGLQHSELLYDFLLPERAGAVSRFYSKLLPDVKLGRLFRRVPNKLLKEKGQHLELFLQSLIQSCEPSKSKSGKYEPITDNPEIQMDQKLHSEMYPDSDWCFGFQSSGMNKVTKVDSFLTGICDYLIFITTRVFKADTWIHHVMAGLKLVVKNTLEPFVHKYLHDKISCYKQEHHVVSLIHLFRDLLFYNKDKPRTAKEKSKREKATFEAWKNFIPANFVRVIGKEKHEAGCRRLFQVLQHPKLNKQLGYLLLDCFLLELFPELNTDTKVSTK
ncbi:sorting nexin-14-like [Ciona intestinalis]